MQMMNKNEIVQVVRKISYVLVLKITVWSVIPEGVLPVIILNDIA